MDKYKKYYGLIIFLVVAFLLIIGAQNQIKLKIDKLGAVDDNIVKQQAILEKKQKDKVIIQNKIKKMQNSMLTSQKKLYAPTESDLGNDTLFFTLYNDVIEMIHANSIKIKAIDYNYNPKDDSFVKSGKDYFVCDVKLELVSNYVNLGKLVEEIYQYPYYIKINELDVKPYYKDKKVLLSNLSLRLYARTEPVDEEMFGLSTKSN